MDEKLIAWARAVKARQVRRGSRLPTLWVFTDAVRLPDPRAALARLPKGLCGVVYRPAEGEPPDLGVALGDLCRVRRFTLVIAGPTRDASTGTAGRHLSRRWQGGILRRGLVTASAHNRREMVRARRAGAFGVFLSPAFPTASHPGEPALGPVRWAALARAARGPVLALGGITGSSMQRLPGFCAGVGVIGAVL